MFLCFFNVAVKRILGHLQGLEKVGWFHYQTSPVIRSSFWSSRKNKKPIEKVDKLSIWNGARIIRNFNVEILTYSFGSSVSKVMRVSFHRADISKFKVMVFWFSSNSAILKVVTDETIFIGHFPGVLPLSYLSDKKHSCNLVTVPLHLTNAMVDLIEKSKKTRNLKYILKHLVLLFHQKIP